MARSPWRLVFLSLRDLSFAFAIGGLLAVPFFFSAKRHHHDRYTFLTMPAEDLALREWVTKSPGTEGVEIRREANDLYLEYRNRSLSAVMPPWSTLGYANLKTGHQSYPFLPDVDPAASILILVTCGQLGFLILGLRRMRVAGRAGELTPTPLEGPWLRAAGAGLLAGAGLFAFGWGYGWATQTLFGSSSGSMWVAIRSFPSWGKFAIVAAGGLAAPLCEEVFFRGGCFASFAGAGHPRAGAWVSATLFSAAHFNLQNAVAYVVFGLVFVWLYRRTRSLVAPIVAHAVNNIAAFSLILLSGT